MKKLIYQVAIGPQTNLYDYCTNSAEEYAKRIGADYIKQTQPILRIAPNPFMNEREGKTGGWKKLGYMPIFEKENVFNYFGRYDQCCVIDADIYVKPDSPDIFDELDSNYAVGSIYEADLPITDIYANKIRNYSNMLKLFPLDWEYHNRTGYHFFNSGVMLYNSSNMIKVLKGMDAKQFLEQSILADFINGKGPLKWQSDQITLNYWFKRNNVEVKKLDWKWNALYSAVTDDKIKDCYFAHFFLRDHLPNKGENVEEIISYVK